MSSTSTSGLAGRSVLKSGQEPRYDRAYGEEVYGYYRVRYT